MADDKVAETTPESEVNEVAEEAKPEAEVKEEKTPETPVTEPITNGSSTPETPKVETPAVAEPTEESSEKDRAEIKTESEPEQLPVNGLSLDEPKIETPEPEQKEPSKPVETTVESSETVPATEIPVKKEVCVDQMPLIEPTPPPLPANPPPSSVASFAATTMAPELTDASLAKTAELTTNTPPTTTTDTITKDDTIENNPNDIQNTLSDAEIAPPEPSDDIAEKHAIDCKPEEINDTKIPEVIKNDEQCLLAKSVDIPEDKEEVKESGNIMTDTPVEISIVTPIEIPIEEPIEIPNVTPIEISNETPIKILNETPIEIPDETPIEISDETVPELQKVIEPEIVIDQEDTLLDLNTVESEITANVTDEIFAAPVGDASEPGRENTPSPLPSVIDEDGTTQNDADDLETEVHDSSEIILESPMIVINSDLIDSNSIKSNDDNEIENLKHKTKDAIENPIENTECNGDIQESKIITNGDTTPPAVCLTDEGTGEAGKVATPEDSMPPSLSEANEALPQGDGSESFPLPPSELCRTESEVSQPATPEPIADAPSDMQQEMLKTDIIAELIPEIPAIPELKTEMETTSDVAVAN